MNDSVSHSIYWYYLPLGDIPSWTIKRKDEFFPTSEIRLGSVGSLKILKARFKEEVNKHDNNKLIINVIFSIFLP